MAIKREPPDKSLVDRLIAAVAEYSDLEAGDLVGLSYQTIANYRAGNWARLEAATRRKILDFLATSGRQRTAEIGAKTLPGRKAGTTRKEAS